MREAINLACNVVSAGRRNPSLIAYSNATVPCIACFISNLFVKLALSVKILFITLPESESR